MSEYASICRMSEPRDQQITITLTPTQVDYVMRAVSRSTAPGISALLSGSLRMPAERGRARRSSGEEGRTRHGKPVEADRRLSRSLLRGLSILTCFASAEEERGIVELAREAGMSASTAHRYALTLIELGLLERAPNSRKYRLPAAPRP
ncbi:MAG TPA: helix-turn-helix domain-containing protein [Polyangia bacterium]|nr:helix-turn-helix domain-containing protein [Polyangia bacterium]